MRITDEITAIEFLNSVSDLTSRSDTGLSVKVSDALSPVELKLWEAHLGQHDPPPRGELKQGLVSIALEEDFSRIEIFERPSLYAFANVPPGSDLIAPMTGVLVDCYDPHNGLFLLQIRGKGIESSYDLQGAAAGDGRFRRPLLETARAELGEEAGLYYARFFPRSLGISLFMKGPSDRSVPQVLFTYTALNDLERFPHCSTAAEIDGFKAGVIGRLRAGEISKEGYHFTVPGSALVRVVDQLHDGGHFYGPIKDSIMRSVGYLRSKGHNL